LPILPGEEFALREQEFYFDFCKFCKAEFLSCRRFLLILLDFGLSVLGEREVYKKLPAEESGKGKRV